MTSRGPFQPQPFCDSLIGESCWPRNSESKEDKMAKSKVSIILKYFVVYLENMKCVVQIPSVIMVVIYLCFFFKL